MDSLKVLDPEGPIREADIHPLRRNVLFVASGSRRFLLARQQIGPAKSTDRASLAA